jgi:hypothetical protein
MRKKDPNKYPKGLNAAKVRAIIDYYDRHQGDDLAAHEILTAKEAATTWMCVPTDLVAAIRTMINRRRKPRKPRRA